MSSLLFPATGLDATSTNSSEAGVNINANAIIGVTGATQLVHVNGCNTRSIVSGFSTTTILWLAAGVVESLTPLDIANIIASQIKLSYQAVNGLNSQVCNPLFWQITSGQYQTSSNRQSFGSAANTGKFYNVSYTVQIEELLLPAQELSLIYVLLVVSGSCIGCSSDTDHFNSVTARRRIKLLLPCRSYVWWTNAATIYFGFNASLSQILGNASTSNSSFFFSLLLP